MTLSPDDIEALTGKRRPAAQRAVLAIRRKDDENLSAGQGAESGDGAAFCAGAQEGGAMNEGKVWSLLRSALSMGACIGRDDSAGKFDSHEHYSAHLDAVAAGRTAEFLSACESDIGRVTQERDEARAEREMLRAKCAEADQLFHDAIATGRQIQAECERLRTELRRGDSMYIRTLDILRGIYALLYPPIAKTEDGKQFEFRPKNMDPHQLMQNLSDRIRAVPDAIDEARIAAAIDAARKGE